MAEERRPVRIACPGEDLSWAERGANQGTSAVAIGGDDGTRLAGPIARPRLPSRACASSLAAAHAIRAIPGEEKTCNAIGSMLPNCSANLAFDFWQRMPNCYLMVSYATFSSGLYHAGNLITGN